MFLNVSELSGHSSRFGQRLKEAVEAALENGDEDLLTVDVARLFLDRQTEEMMDAFRRYCVRSVSALVYRLLWPMVSQMTPVVSFVLRAHSYIVSETTIVTYIQN